jgi:hypothetical protein
MTKNDYVTIATVVRGERDRANSLPAPDARVATDVLDGVVRGIVSAATQEGKRFNKDLFLLACGL